MADPWPAVPVPPPGARARLVVTLDGAPGAGAGRSWLDLARTLASWALVAPLAVWLAVRVAGVGAGTRVETLLVLTPYVALASVVAVAVVVALRPAWPARAAAGACCLGYVLVMAPLFTSGPQPWVPPGGPEVRVMTVNVLYGRADAAAVVALVRERDVDVLGVQELTPAFHQRLVDEGLDDVLGHSVTEQRSDSSGTGLYSRHPVERAAHQVEGWHENPTVRVHIDGAQPVEVTVVHPVPPVGADGRRDWQRTFRTLPRPDPDGPVRLVIGDFNATVDQPTLRNLLDDGYVDAAGAAGRGWVATWRLGLAPPLAIDHVLVDRSVAVRGASVRDIPGSDHRAVVADLLLPAP